MARLGFPRLVVLLAVLAAAVAVAVAACGGSGERAEAASGGKPTVVVTYSILGSVVRELLGDRADVRVIMPNGVDPHEYQPSAKDAEAIMNADLLVENGLGLEEGLRSLLDQAESEGVPTFAAADHVDVRTVGEGEVAGADDPDEQPGAQDPHLWMDPLAMRDVVAALAPFAATTLRLDLDASAARLERRLTELNAADEQALAAIPHAERKLVTGHESMGYFARRYRFELVGALVPSLSSQAEVSAGDLAALVREIEDQGVPALFTELGTPPEVAEAVGGDAGVRVIEIATHKLPDDGSYFTFMEDVVSAIADGLSR
jgi:zinc/manganese transport system substrate-binding protein